MKWFPKNINFTKNKSGIVVNDSEQSTILATLGEDGLVLLWDLKHNELNNRTDITLFNMKPLIRVEVNRMDCKNLF